MHLHGKFFVGKKKFQQQRETLGIRRRIAHQFASVLRTQIAERVSLKGPFATLPCIASEPGFADLLVELWLG